jgi:SNF2-related domain
LDKLAKDCLLEQVVEDELYRRFQLPFEILTNDKLEAARTGNWFSENNLVIARLDKLSRDEDVQHKLQAPECRWDLVVCDEAHKLSATFFGGEVKYTKRYHLGQLLSGLTRHFLLMTATPHNGKEEDFQLFMALLDGDRFEGRFRDGVHQVEIAGLMRRMVRENLLKFDGTPLFPERVASTVPSRLSDAPEERAALREWLDESDPDTMAVIRERVRQIRAGEATLIDGNQVQQEMRQLARQIANQ